MKKRREINVFSISFLDLLSGALGAVIILYVAIPKNTPVDSNKVDKSVVESYVKELDEADKKLKQMQENLTTLTSKVAELEKKPEPVPVAAKQDFDVGFKFKGKKVLFIIDTSLSMREEDRIGQVKAGLKMLLTALPAEFSVDVIQYPLGQRAPFKPLWGSVRNNSAENKHEVLDFIYNLKPFGGTPTRDVLLYALRNYQGNITDIVLLSDGAPSLHNSNQKDDIYDILKVVRESNQAKVQINTIGVGSDFIYDKTSSHYQFLSLLAEETDGFFVGF